MKTKLNLLSLATLAVCAVTLTAQGGGGVPAQGEGTLGDFTLNTAVNGGMSDATDKGMAPFDILTVSLASPAGGCAGRGFILAGDIRPVSESFVEVGVVGLNSSTRFLIYDSVFNAAFGAIIPPSGIPFNLNFAIPCSTNWAAAPGTGLWLQAAGLNPTSMTALFGIYEVSETVKHSVTESPYPCQWYDTCDDAVAAPGLTDADLGFNFLLDTTLAADDVDANGLNETFGTDVTFTMVVAGAANNATGSDGPSGDYVAKFTAGGGLYTFDLCASDYDSRVWITPVGCPTAMTPVTGIASNDDASGDSGGACLMPGDIFASRLRNICLAPGQQVLLVVDGYAGSEGLASLIITKVAIAATGLSPVSGDIAGGESITISGCGLSGVNSVTFDGIPATIGPVTNTSLVVTAPAHAAGAVDVVITDGVNSVTLTNGYTYLSGGFMVCSSPALPVVFGVQSDTLSIPNSGAISSLNIDMNITHTWRGDLLVDLMSPAGTVLRLHNGAGGSADNLIGNYPGTLIPSGGGASSGPAFNLSDFTGEDPFGVWTLTVEDIDPADSGTLNMWCVNGSL